MEPAEITLRKWETIPEAFQTGLRKHVAVQGLPGRNSQNRPFWFGTRQKACSSFQHVFSNKWGLAMVSHLWPWSVQRPAMVGQMRSGLVRIKLSSPQGKKTQDLNKSVLTKFPQQVFPNKFSQQVSFQHVFVQQGFPNKFFPTPFFPNKFLPASCFFNKFSFSKFFFQQVVPSKLFFPASFFFPTCFFPTSGAGHGQPSLAAQATLHMASRGQAWLATLTYCTSGQERGAQLG